MGERTRELFILVAGDMVCFSAGLWLTLAFRYFSWPQSELLASHFGPFSLLAVIWIFVFFISGLYDKHTTYLKQSLKSRIILAQIINVFVAAAFFFALPLGIAPKTNLVIYLVISVVLVLSWRLRLFDLFAPRARHRAILIADGAEAIELVDEVNNNDRYHYSFVRIIDARAAERTSDLATKLLSLIDTENITIIVANPRSAHTEAILPVLFERAFLKFEFTFLDFNKVYEETFDRVPVSALSHNWFIANISQTRTIGYDLIKRMVDIVGALVMLVPCTVLFPLIALAIRIEDRGPIFYITERIGQFNAMITIFKFRTMTGTDHGSSALRSELRVTKIGAFLRKTRLDELPQLWNVLRGDLSFIGPRPEMPSLASVYAREIPYYNARHFIKPGLSGWAQINNFDVPRGGVDVERTKSKLALDLYYLRRRSLMVDAHITMKTIATLLMRTGT